MMDDNDKNKLIKQLKCDNIECHVGRDVLDSVWEAIHQTPACGINAILCAAAQEIDALRAMTEKTGSPLISRPENTPVSNID